MEGTEERARIRVLLCGTPIPDRSSLLQEITVREVLDPAGDPSIDLLRPGNRAEGSLLVPLEDLEQAVAETAPDLVLVLAGESALTRARHLCEGRRPKVEVIGLTPEGHALLNLGPQGLRELIRATVAVRAPSSEP